MSHNNPYRRPPSDSDLRPKPGPYSSSGSRHASPDHDFYRSPQESFSSSYPTSSSSRGAQCSQDGALNILSSCGLEPSDLALLAELPEDVLTVESLPHVLKQIKGKRGTVKPFPHNAPSPFPSSSSYAPSSTHQFKPSTSDWDHPRNQLHQYPVDRVTPSALPLERDRWENPTTFSSVGADPPPPPPSSSSSLSSSSYVVDFHHRPGLSEYGKTGRDTGPASFQDRPSFSSAGRGKTTRPSRFSQLGPADHRSAPPPEEHHLKTRGGQREFESSSTRSSSQLAVSIPCKKEALDFHGTSPPVFPYSCSLCDITVMSEKVWIKHINGTQHADGQLSLLQRFPNWDCRMETVSRADNQSEKRKDEGEPGWPPQPANQNPKPQPNKKLQKKTSEKGKVVCVKFPAQSVDETYLRKLTEPFGKVVKILMFPSLAFVELGSTDQAKDLVKFHVNYPPTVNGEAMEFNISNTFNFLQSSRVVSFTPAPTGKNGQSDLISIIKRFGVPLYTLFLPSKAFVEMKNNPDAQKMVDYYSSNTLRINSDLIKVSFSGEYKSLMRVASAKRYDEENQSPTRTLSQEKDAKTTEAKRRSSKDQNQARSRSRSRERSTKDVRTRTRSRERSTKDRRTRSSSRERSTIDGRTRTRSRSRERSTKDGRTRTRSRERSTKDGRTRSRSRERSTKDGRTRTRSRSRERSTIDGRTRTRSRSRERSTKDGRTRTRSRSRSKSVVPEQTEVADTKSRTDPDPAPVRDSKPEAEEEELTEEEAESSAEESDIEGMEVIGEDGDNLEDEDMDTLEEEEEQDTEKEMKDGGADDQEDPEVEQQQENKVEKDKPIHEEDESESTQEAAETLQEDEEEPDFPVDLEHCITLDELGEDQSEDQEEEEVEPESPSNRVVCFQNLPLHLCTDAEFIKLVRGFGTAVRYLRLRPQQQGFIEMSTSSEALTAVKELTRKPVTFNSSKLHVHISNHYKTLTNGWPVQLDQDKETKSEGESNRKSEGRKESEKKPEEESASKKTPEEESASRKTPEEESASRKTAEEESASRKTPEEESASRKTPEEESASRKTLEEESASKKTPEEESVSRKTPEEESAPRKTSEEESASRKTPEEESASRKTSEEESASKQTPKSELLPQTRLKRKETHENDSGKKEEKKKESASDKAAEAPEEEQLEVHEKEGLKETSEPGLKASESPDQPGSTEEPLTEQKPTDQLQQSGPAGGVVKLEEPTRPVGTEFVRPVVGYFCNLCQLIYADEDEAKLQHCSSLTHYRKYQEKTGKDPWTS